MRNLLIFLSVLMFMIGAGGLAGATTISFTDQHNPAPIILNFANPSHSFTHDINDDGFNPLMHEITSAEIWLCMWDAPPLEGDPPYEFVQVLFDGGSYDGSSFFEVTLGGYSFELAFSILQNDGLINVDINRMAGDFVFNKSTLFVDATVIPIPGAILLLGSGLIGLASFKKIFKG
ncbi:MAG: hypothetical protein JRI85_04095 [Deltaproteobacteria bacterium]|nr:hypothetical protein [Deltaproteobacteria bacterium]